MAKKAKKSGHEPGKVYEVKWIRGMTSGEGMACAVIREGNLRGGERRLGEGRRVKG